MKTKYIILLAIISMLAYQGRAQLLIFSDNFSTSNSVWRFNLNGTHADPTAIAASYGIIANGMLQLKANVDCGWDYLGSRAVLGIPLPAEYEIDFSANKTQWCGGFHAFVAVTNLTPTDPYADGSPNLPWYDIYVAGSVFGQLRINTVQTNYDAQPINSSFSYGTWYNYRIVKKHNSIMVYVNNSLQWSYNGNVLDGGVFYFEAEGAGATAQIKNFALYDLSTIPHLNLTTAITISQQNTSHVSGVITTTTAPKLLKLTTKDILNALAFDEHVEGNWPSNSFPKNTTLALAGNSIVVLNGTNMLLNVSDIMSYNTGEPQVTSGKQNTATGLASPTAQKLQIAGISFDDTFINGGNNLKFYLDGVSSKTTTDTAPVNGVYTETQNLTISNAAGDGSSQDVTFTCTGSVSATGKSPLHL